MKHLLLGLYLYLLGVYTAKGQTTYFNRLHDLQPNGYSFSTSLQARSDGYVVTGRGDDDFNPAPGSQLMVAFFDSAGQLRRQRLFTHPAGDELSASFAGPLVGLPDGGFASCGLVNIADTTQAMLWRFNASGDTLWTRIYRSTPPVSVFAVYSGCYQPTDSGFALVGFQRTPTRREMLLIRTDKYGHERWRRTYHHSNHVYNSLEKVLVTPDGGLLLTGYSAPNRGPNDPINGQWLVIKTDATGQEQWRYTLDGPYLDAASPAVVLPDGSYLIGGAYGTWGDVATYFGYPMLVRLDAQGGELWRRTYGPDRYNTGATALQLLPDGTALLAGLVAEPMPNNVTGSMQAFVVKVCAATGDSIWYRTYRNLPHPADNYIYDLALTPDGGFAAAGFLHPRQAGLGAAVVWLFKADADGYLQPGGAPVTVQCRPITGTSPDSPAETPIDLYPNPTGPDGRFSLDAPPGATLTLTDALGRQVWRKTHLTLRTSDLELPHPGLYLLRLAWPDGCTTTRKLVME